MFGKSINRKYLHEQFEILLRYIQPKEDLIKAFEIAVKGAYDERKSDDIEYKKNLQ